MKRELKVKELRALDATRRRFLGHQQAVQEAELHRLDDQLQQRVQQRESETRRAVEDLEVRALELERQRAQVEQELSRANQEVSSSLVPRPSLTAFFAAVSSQLFLQLWIFPQLQKKL